ncbi:hypothetical protein CR513_29588, partial [Mucuna pruriens]
MLTPHFPHIFYSDGDSLYFTVAESTIEFPCLIGDTARNVRDLPICSCVAITYPKYHTRWGMIVPSYVCSNHHFFPNYGFSICMTFGHVVAAWKSIHHFMKS